MLLCACSQYEYVLYLIIAKTTDWTFAYNKMHIYKPFLVKLDRNL